MQQQHSISYELKASRSCEDWYEWMLHLNISASIIAVTML